MLGETVRATVTVAEIRAAQQLAVLKTVCDVGGRVVLSGEAVVMPTWLAERMKAQATRCSA
jgi:3-hydroxybutyryl-CoA dehydratase